MLLTLSTGNVFAETHRENVVEIDGIYYSTTNLVHKDINSSIISNLNFR